METLVVGVVYLRPSMKLEKIQFWHLYSERVSLYSHKIQNIEVNILDEFVTNSQKGYRPENADPCLGKWPRSGKGGEVIQVESPLSLLEKLVSFPIPRFIRHVFQSQNKNRVG
jgi:hypothetical protein